jgi:transcriptional regulator with XRE-family HTH domain
MARQIEIMATPQQKGPLTPELLGRFVRAKRTQARLRIDDAAALCGVSVETISKIETAKAGVRMESLFKVLSGLGIQLRVEPWK